MWSRHVWICVFYHHYMVQYNVRTKHYKDKVSDQIRLNSEKGVLSVFGDKIYHVKQQYTIILYKFGYIKFLQPVNSDKHKDSIRASHYCFLCIQTRHFSAQKARNALMPLTELKPHDCKNSGKMDFWRNDSENFPLFLFQCSPFYE